MADSTARIRISEKGSWVGHSANASPSAPAQQRKVTVSAHRGGGRRVHQTLGTQKWSPALLTMEAKARVSEHLVGRWGLAPGGNP